MPVLSLKQLEDLAFAYAWLQVAGKSHSAIDLYYAMLRHKPKSKFPGGRYPDILTALGAPNNVMQIPQVRNLAISIRNEAYALHYGS